MICYTLIIKTKDMFYSSDIWFQIADLFLEKLF